MWMKEKKGREDICNIKDLFFLCLQRTERAPKDRNVAETDPKKFSAMLIERLEKVIEEQEKITRIENSFKTIEVSLTDDSKGEALSSYVV